MTRARKPALTAIQQWLEAEIAGLEQQAESRLSRVFSAVECPSPGAGLSRATLQRLGLGGRKAARTAGLAYRVAVAVSLGLAALAASLAPSLAGLRAPLLISWFSGTLVSLARRLDEAVTFWRLLSDVSEIVAEAAASPATLSILVLALFLSFGSLRVLAGLVLVERGKNHA